jgi:hypothetical protein
MINGCILKVNWSVWNAKKYDFLNKYGHISYHSFCDAYYVESYASGPWRGANRLKFTDFSGYLVGPIIWVPVFCLLNDVVSTYGRNDWIYMAHDMDKLYNTCICLKGLRETKNVSRGSWNPRCDSNWAPTKYMHRVQ